MCFRSWVTIISLFDLYRKCVWSYLPKDTSIFKAVSCGSLVGEHLAVHGLGLHLRDFARDVQKNILRKPACPIK